MGKIKRALAVSLSSAIFLAPSLFAKNNLEQRTNYEVHCSIFHVGNSYYQLKETKKEYNIIMKAWPTGFFQFLGLNYSFSTEGYKEKENLCPEHFKRINTKKAESLITEVTDIYYDYENMEAKSYAYKEIDGKREIKHDTMNNPEKITKDVKDFLTFLEELKRGELKDYYRLKTIAKGKVHPFEIRKTGEEIIKIGHEYYATAVYETDVDTEMFGLDSKVKLWVHTGKDHTLLKCWIENGPLWTSIILEYAGKKSDLR